MVYSIFVHPCQREDIQSTEEWKAKPRRGKHAYGASKKIFGFIKVSGWRILRDNSAH